MSSDEPDAATSVKAFKDAVNMSAKALTAWLATDESKEVGFEAREGEESAGHKSGKKIVTLLDKTQLRFTSADSAHARKVVGYIHRHLAQRPDDDVSETQWRYSLMNRGHDPQKDKSRRQLAVLLGAA